MRISDWSSDVCSSDLPVARHRIANHRPIARLEDVQRQAAAWKHQCARKREYRNIGREILVSHHSDPFASGNQNSRRSEEHTSELQSLMRISYAVFCLKKKKKKTKYI